MPDVNGTAHISGVLTKEGETRTFLGNFFN